MGYENDRTTNEITIDRTKILSEDEWLGIINNEARSQDISEKERRTMAQMLAYHFMTIDDAIELTEQQLVTKFHIHSRSLVEQIFEWQKTLPKNTMQTTNEALSLDNEDSSYSPYENKPLVGLYETMKSEITEGDVIDAFRQLRTINEKQTGGFFQSYQTFIDVLVEYGSKRYKDKDRIWFRCRSCRKTLWIAENMGAFTSFPACFSCQLKSWATMWGIKIN